MEGGLGGRAFRDWEHAAVVCEAETKVFQGFVHLEGPRSQHCDGVEEVVEELWLAGVVTGSTTRSIGRFWRGWRGGRRRPG